ncbi:MAG: trypsin-like serine protease [Deltaproteobacteria bacterium]|nr:trypsin-like serine protease [Deltaproteobacteria bacterium]
MAHLHADGTQQRQAAFIIVHPQYNTATRNDLALIFLNSALDLSGSKDQAVRMAASTDAAAFAAGRAATVSGWGRTGVTEGISLHIDWIMDNVDEVCTPQPSNIVETGLTANNSPAPFVGSASSTYSDSRYKEWKAFDNSIYWTQWISGIVK